MIEISTITILIFAIVFFVVIGFIVMQVIKTIKEDKLYISAIFLTKKGDVDIVKKVKINPAGQFDFREGTYNTNRTSRLINNKKRPTFLYIEGISEPLDFSDVKTIKDLKEVKINASNLKKVLGNKLFDDLLNSGNEKLMTNVLFFITIVNLIVCLVIAFKIFTPAK